jgi:alpha 1,4-glycosyltransferase
MKQRGTTNSNIKCAPGNEVMAYCIEKIESMDLKRLRWGQIGPDLLNHAVKKVFGLGHLVLDYRAFNPIPWYDFMQLFRKHRDLPKNTVAVHLYQNMWRRHGMNWEGRYDEACLFEKLRRCYR